MRELQHNILPHFTLPITPGGPVLAAFVGVSQARIAALTQAQQPIPNPVQVSAMVDTGASCTCVDPSVLGALNLTPTGPITMNTPSTGSTPHTAFQYDASLFIPGSTQGQIPLFLPNIAVTSAELLAAQGFHALIGRDILAHCILVYNGDTGLFMLAY